MRRIAAALALGATLTLAGCHQAATTAPPYPHPPAGPILYQPPAPVSWERVDTLQAPPEHLELGR